MKKKYPSDATRSMRRRIQKARTRSDRSNRWIATMTKLLKLAGTQTHPDESEIKRAINCLAVKIRQAAVASPSITIMKAITQYGCSTVAEVSEQTLLSKEVVEAAVKELLENKQLTLKERHNTSGPKTYFFRPTNI